MNNPTTGNTTIQEAEALLFNVTKGEESVSDN